MIKAAPKKETCGIIQDSHPEQTSRFTKHSSELKEEMFLEAII